MHKEKVGDYLTEILFFGSLWGLSEVFIENYLVPICAIPRSIILSTVAIFILSIARAHLPKPGLILATGVIAALYKFLNIQFFSCQILALIMLAGSFEIVHLWLFSKKFNSGLLGAFTIIFYNFSFAVAAIVFLRNPWWINGGVSKFLNFVLIEGVITALLAFGVYPLGKGLGNSLMNQRSVWTKSINRIYQSVSLLFVLSVAIVMVVI